MYKIITFLVFSHIATSQNLVRNYNDEFTKEKIIQVNASKLPKWKTTDNIATGFFNNVFLSLKSEDIKKVLTLDVTTGYNICVSSFDGKTILLLEDESTIALPQVSKIDCATRVAINYYLLNEDLDKLSITKINKIRIYATEGYIDFVIKEDKKEIIKNTFSLFKKQFN